MLAYVHSALAAPLVCQYCVYLTADLGELILLLIFCNALGSRLFSLATVSMLCNMHTVYFFQVVSSKTIIVLSLPSPGPEHLHETHKRVPSLSFLPQDLSLFI